MLGFVARYFLPWSLVGNHLSELSHFCSCVSATRWALSRSLLLLSAWVECLALSLSASLIFPAFPWLSLPHVEPSPILSWAVACLIFQRFQGSSGGSRSIHVHYKCFFALKLIHALEGCVILQCDHSSKTVGNFLLCKCNKHRSYGFRTVKVLECLLDVRIHSVCLAHISMTFEPTRVD